jgi:hypothetical protein
MRRIIMALTLVCAGIAGSGHAQNTAKSARIVVELNTAATSDAGCTMTFVVSNAHDADLTKLVYETVLFDTAGQVERLTLFDFGILPAGRQRVRQFVLPNLQCESVSQVLFNGANECEGLDNGLCDTTLEPQSRTDIKVSG